MSEDRRHAVLRAWNLGFREGQAATAMTLREPDRIPCPYVRQGVMGQAYQRGYRAGAREILQLKLFPPQMLYG